MIIGITGGVGCGKSTVTSIMKEKYGFVVLEADKIGHMLMEPGQIVYKKIVEHFSEIILNKDKTVDRKKLGDIVFRNDKELEFLNGIIHPGVKEFIADRLEKSIENENFIIESAILIEAGYRDICDEIWYIYVDEKIRRERLKKSRGYTDEKIDAIIANQAKDGDYRKFADVLIDNSKSVENIEAQIKKIVEF